MEFKKKRKQIKKEKNARQVRINLNKHLTQVSHRGEKFS